MYIIKNAFRCISRSKGRNILIGIIALVIAISACLGLSIRQAAESAKASALDAMTITATISYDRSGAMNQMGRPSSGGGFDREQFSSMMGSASSLTLEEQLTYAQAESVEDFYYTLTAYFNGSDTLLPVTDETEEEDLSEQNGFPSKMPGNMGGFGGMMGGMGGMQFASGDFSIIGYSSDSAMSSFISGTSSILEGGVLFEEGTEDLTCVISEELALYNDLYVGDEIIITNPTAETETYTLTISGIYTSTANNDFSMSMFGTSQDPANAIYMSANALQAILNATEENSTTITDSNGRETETKVNATLAATYAFASADDYYAFEEQARALSLGENYTISSADVAAFENSIAPLETLSTMAGWFLLVILIIGAIILVVLNIFNVRERKYEVGVLTAMGMKKWKVATQFICEILVVTMIAVILGAGVGAVSSVPVTNALLQNQIESQNSQMTQIGENMGRPGNFGGGFGGGMNFGGMDIPSDPPADMGGGKNPFGSIGDMFNSAEAYITEVDSAMNLTVVAQMLGIGLLLTLVASAASVLFVMRYDPLKILANRD